MARFMVYMTDEELVALAQLAREQVRETADQVQYIVRQELIRLGRTPQKAYPAVEPTKEQAMGEQGEVACECQHIRRKDG